MEDIEYVRIFGGKTTCICPTSDECSKFKVLCKRGCLCLSQIIRRFIQTPCTEDVLHSDVKNYLQFVVWILTDPNYCDERKCDDKACCWWIDGQCIRERIRKESGLNTFEYNT